MTHERTRDTAPLPDEPYYQQPPAYNQPMQPPTRPNSARRAGIALIIVGLLWLAFALPGRGLMRFGGGGSTTTLLDKTYPAQRIALSVGAADVTVQRWAERGVRVEAVQHGGSRNDHSINAQVDGDLLKVTQSQPGFGRWFSAGDVHYDVYVPENTTAVRVETSSGDIQISDVPGFGQRAVTLATTSGDISADGIANLAINTTSGNVHLKRITGALEATTVSGDVALNDGRVQGATVKTTSGDIDLHGIAGAVTLSSTNGDVTVRDAASSQLNINVTNSSVEYHGSLAPASQNKIEAVNGDIQVYLPRNSGFALHADTVSGDLKLDDDFKAQRKNGNGTALDATVGDGAATLNVQTISGDVEIGVQ